MYHEDRYSFLTLLNDVAIKLRGARFSNTTKLSILCDNNLVRLTSCQQEIMQDCAIIGLNSRNTWKIDISW